MEKSKRKLKKFFKAIFIFFAVILTVFLITFIVINAKINHYKKTVDFDEKKLTSAYFKPKIISNNGDEISSFKFSQTIKASNLKEHTKEAFISIEDKKFYSHNGINPGRIVKAFFTNIKNRSFKEGASTISQQLVKNAFLSSEKSIDRKLKEIALTQKLEEKYTKDEILEIYLNTIYFGNNIYGIENAAKTYFNKSASDLTLNESACLAGIIKSPSYFTKQGNSEALTNRKNLVLSEMLKDSKITQDEYNENINKKITLNILEKNQTQLPYQNAVINEACEILKISENEFLSSGCTVETYFDENASKLLLSSVQKEKNIYNYGGIIIDNETGGVVALTSNLNNFSNLKRQIGSTIKPILVYTPAIQSGKYVPESFVVDEPININGYSPKNVNGKYLGAVTILTATSKSLNIPAVKILNEIGIENCKQSAEKFGLSFCSEDNNLSLALGASKNGENLINLTGAYSTLARNGRFKKATFIKQIKDKNGMIIYRNNNLTQEATNSETAYLITKMLKNSAKNGTAKLLSSLDFDIASKTGTVGVGHKGKNSDAYNIAFTSNHTIGVWIGSDNNEEANLMPKEINGSTTPTKICKSFLQEFYKNETPPNFSKPEGIKEVYIDAQEYENNKLIYIADANAPDRFKKAIEVPYFVNFEKSPNSFSESQTISQNAKMDFLSRNFIFNYSKKELKSSF